MITQKSQYAFLLANIVTIHFHTTDTGERTAWSLIILLPSFAPMSPANEEFHPAELTQCLKCHHLYRSLCNGKWMVFDIRHVHIQYTVLSLICHAISGNWPGIKELKSLHEKDSDKNIIPLLLVTLHHRPTPILGLSFLKGVFICYSSLSHLPWIILRSTELSWVGGKLSPGTRNPHQITCLLVLQFDDHEQLSLYSHTY